MPMQVTIWCLEDHANILGSSTLSLALSTTNQRQDNLMTDIIIGIIYKDRRDCPDLEFYVGVRRSTNNRFESSIMFHFQTIDFVGTNVCFPCLQSSV